MPTSSSGSATWTNAAVPATSRTAFAASTPSVPAGEVQLLTLELDPCFHRLLPGHRLRLQVSGG
ncbi:MAG TPA: CocE/NonD family hydrolase C-terminal non-catalytic domain-containing protein, partial [Actinoplanes sp.]|nr:CocE/NonD family hydrolase C-terminal non-catalytic domain-containing protein [Actinoplanes sp.]